MSSKLIQHLGAFILVGEGFQAIDAIEKIHQCVIVESYNGASEDLSTEFFCDVEGFDIAALWEFQPDVRIQGGGGNPLQNGCRHSGELKPNAFLCERVNKPSERRWALVHRPPFVGRGGEASGEQDSFVLAETGDFFQKPFHALAIFFAAIPAKAVS